MNLREFLTNSIEFMTRIKKEDRLDKGWDPPQSYPKFLGIPWKSYEDQIIIKFLPLPTFPTCPPTRRSVLKELASIFDPLGLSSPCILFAKKCFSNAYGV